MQRGRDSRPECARWLLEDGSSQCGGSASGKRPLARTHLVQNHPESPDIGSRIGDSTGEHFGRHIRRRADRDAGLCDRLRHGGRLGTNRRSLRQPEVEDLRVTFGSDHDVGALQIAVNHAVWMCVRERVRNLGAVPQRRFRWKAAERDHRGERSALHELHGDERPALDLADLVNSADVWMIELREGLGLADESLVRRLVFQRSGMEHLDRDVTRQRGIVGSIHDSHSARPKGVHDSVTT